MPPIDQRKRDESLDKFIKLREDKSPNKLVSEIKTMQVKNELKNKAQQIKQRMKGEQQDERPSLQLYTESDDEEFQMNDGDGGVKIVTTTSAI